MSGDCGCGCGGSATATMTELAGTGFVRPKFFGGMLLTEDDLQAAIDYTVAKRKLTNREVIGAGVVCGLTVKPDPCDTPDTMKRQADDLITTVGFVGHREAILQTLREDAEPIVAAPNAAEFRKIQVDPAKPEAGVHFDQAVKLVNRVVAARAQEASI